VWGVAPLSASAAEDGDLSPGTAPWAIASSRQLSASSRCPARVPPHFPLLPSFKGRRMMRKLLRASGSAP
jgi:hypothetical protein